MVPFLRLRCWHAWCVAGLLFVLGLGPAAAEPRVALVIGNGAYASVARLPNAASDAKLMGRTLTDLGFKVTELIDADQAAMKTAIADFGRALRASGPDTVGLFYYAGHGVQAAGVNYLLPVNSTIRDEADLDLVGVEGRWVVRQMESARNQTNIVILDACRDNPFAAAGATGQGLARMDAPTGTFIAYSTAPGTIAMDGRGGNSPFTTALAAAMIRPGQPMEPMFRQVRVAVLKETGGRQTPWDSSSLVREFVFNPGTAAAPRASAEQQDWDSARGSRDPGQILQFMRSYPRSMHTEEAQALLQQAQSPRTMAVSATAVPRFSAPLALGAPEVDGRSMEQLIQGAPAFPPIEGLPPPAWEGKSCPTCHQRPWTQKTLCDQGLFYIKSGDARMLSVRHPFGHAFGAALKAWAASGCP